MASAKDLRRLALSLDGTTESPHFERTAFKVERNYATLPSDGRTANLKFAPEEQELRCLVRPGAFTPIANVWGRRGWTTADLAALTIDELRAALEMAWRHALPTKRAR